MACARSMRERSSTPPFRRRARTFSPDAHPAAPRSRGTGNSFSPETSSGDAFGGVRWVIIGLICMLTVINYIDRQTLSVLAPTIREAFGMSNVSYARVVTTFLLGYTLSQAISGRLLDRIGTRAGFMLFVGIWTVASMLHSIAGTVVQLAALRFLLGVGEAGNWPGAAKAVAEWFPVRERAFAMAIFNSGSTVGAVIAPPVIAWVALTYGWRKAFFIGAGLSALMMVLWYFFYFTPDRNPRLSASEREYIRAGQGADDAGGAAARPWLSLFGYRQVWAVIAGRFFTDPIWWFLISWLPNYLKSERGFSLQLIGLLAWISFSPTSAPSAAGRRPAFLIRRGWTVNAARKVVLVASILLVPLGVALIITTSSDAAAIAGASA